MVRAKSHRRLCHCAKSRENIRSGIFATVLHETSIVHSLCTEVNESLRFPLLFSFQEEYPSTEGMYWIITLNLSVVPLG